MAKVIPVTDPDEAASLFLAGILMWQSAACAPEKLVQGWSVEEVRKWAGVNAFGRFVILVEDDEEDASPTASVECDSTTANEECDSTTTVSKD